MWKQITELIFLFIFFLSVFESRPEQKASNLLTEYPDLHIFEIVPHFWPPLDPGPPNLKSVNADLCGSGIKPL
jgi:hypothetical protein